jgi:hypothetical protein
MVSNNGNIAVKLVCVPSEIRTEDTQVRAIPVTDRGGL